MATIDAPRSKKHPSPQAAADAPKRRSHPFRRGCICMLLLLLAGAYFAPWVVGLAPVANWVLAWASPLDGTIRLESASLGWFSSVVLQNVSIHDAQGGPVIEIESLTTDKPLIALLVDLDDVGRIEIVRPSLHVVAHQNDTNLEQLLAPLQSVPEPPSASFQLSVTGGAVVVDDVLAAREFHLEDLNVECGHSVVDDELTLNAAGTLTDARQPGTFKID
ncbi:MAG TPA: hypothetical protein VHV08_01375, partial [Pirellulales bacterium]|nr:hypothetical protein [Pirellulales bacterium]